MIFKIAHICYCGNVAEARKQLSVLGYKLNFSERVTPMEITRRYLSCHGENFKMYMWAKPGSINIELLEFEEYSKAVGLIYPLFLEKMNEVSPKKDYDSQIRSDLEKYIPTTFLSHQAYIAKGSQIEDSLFNSFLLFSSDIAKSIQFWTRLGFDCIEQSHKYCILRLHSFFTREDFYIHICDFHQIKPDNVEEDLDSLGFHVLGLISNSTGQERSKMILHGIEVTPIEQIKINNNKLSVFYARSPEGVIAEILSLS